MEKENQKLEIVNRNLELTEIDKVIGIIYKMTNTKTNMHYVGQTRSHRKNRNKYRPFGHIGRFNDHFSEAFTNAKKNQSVYLNNAIRKYGKEVFTIEVIELCTIEALDERETFYIKQCKTLFPNGYNLIEGSREFSKGLVENESELRVPTKRGREFGFTHKEETIKKMKKYFETITDDIAQKKISTMQNSISSHFTEKRPQIIADSNIELDDNFADLIRPHKKDGEIVSYTIRYKGGTYGKLTGKQYSVQEKYVILHDALKKAYEIRKNKNSTNETK